MEDIVEGMRSRDIQVEVLKGDAFRVAYIGEDPQRSCVSPTASRRCSSRRT